MTDDETTVVIGRQKTQGGVYHTRKCNTYPHNPREITIGEAQRRGLHECDVCAHNVNRGEQNGPTIASLLEDMNPDEV